MIGSRKLPEALKPVSLTSCKSPSFQSGRFPGAKPHSNPSECGEKRQFSVLYWDNGKENGNYYNRIGYILGLHWDNGKSAWDLGFDFEVWP